MKLILTIGLLTIFINTALCQITLRVDDDIPFPDLTVKIGEEVSFPDISIEIGSEVSFEDFTVGITDEISEAQFIIIKTGYRDFSRVTVDEEFFPVLNINAGESVAFPDLTIRVAEEVAFPDLTIKIVRSGMVDYLVYTEKEFMSLQDLVIALLPVINYYMDFRFEKLNELFEEQE